MTQPFRLILSVATMSAMAPMIAVMFPMMIIDC